jgi:hypothetical protein
VLNVVDEPPNDKPPMALAGYVKKPSWLLMEISFVAPRVIQVVNATRLTGVNHGNVHLDVHVNGFWWRSAVCACARVPHGVASLAEDVFLNTRERPRLFILPSITGIRGLVLWRWLLKPNTQVDDNLPNPHRPPGPGPTRPHTWVGRARFTASENVSVQTTTQSYGQ